jgi:hypothetical protein
MLLKIGLALALMFVSQTSDAQDRIYILSDREVYSEIAVNKIGVEPPVIIDCKDSKNLDPIGCIIAASDYKKKIAEKRASKR